jgi:hypothetical protein
MAQNGGAQLDWPAQALKLTHANERVLFGRRVALIIEVVQQGSGGIELDERLTLPGVFMVRQPEPICFGLAAGYYADLDRQSVFAQALALCPLRKQSPSLFAAIERVACWTISNGHFLLSPCCFIWFVILWVYPSMIGKS